MSQWIEIRVSFDAGHTASRERCSRIHGHTWTVSVGAFTRTASDGDALQSDLDEFVQELDGKFLNDLFPGLDDYTPEVLVVVFKERFIMRHRVNEFRLSDGHVTAIS